MISCDWPDKTVQNDTKFCPFKMIEESSKPYKKEDTSQGTKTFCTEEINAMVSTKRKRTTEAILGKKFSNILFGRCKHSL